MNNSKTYLIAEIAQGFVGSETLVDLFCNAVLATEADAIKFQIFFADELATSDYKYYDLFKSLELPKAVWEKAVKKIQAGGKHFYSDIFGFDSLNMLLSLGIDGVKVHSTDINNYALLKEIAASKKKVLLSTGGAEFASIDKALEVLGRSNVTLMHGFQAEPTELEDNNLGRIRTLIEKYKLPVGFQDHTAGDSVYAHSLPYTAIGLGANLIEKHMTLSRVAQMEDYVSALNAEEFKVWAEEVKKVNIAIGSYEWKLTEKELKYKTQVRRAVCARKNLSPGHVLKEEDLILKRTGNENAIFDLQSVLGKKLSKTVQASQPVLSESL